MMTKFFFLSGAPVIFAWSLTPEGADNYGRLFTYIIGAVFLGIANVLAARSVARTAVKPIVEKINTIEPLVTATAAHVNSDKTRTEGEIISLRMQIDLQRETIEGLKSSIALLAQARAQADLIKAVSDAAVAGATAPAPAAMVSAPVLVSIDKSAKDTAIHTKETADNTARTEKMVEGLEEHS